MKPKPEILKGEVKEFIDVLSFTGIVINQNKWIENTDLKKQFYSQPFKPEMITGYFEGWKKEPDSLYTYSDTNIPEHIDSSLILSKREKKLFISDLIFVLPKTLSQFITNCIQAGIKLTWKEK